MRQPRWPLEEVKAVAATRNGLLLKKTRALDFFATPKAAYARARQVISQLTVDRFSRSEQLQFDEWFDIYGVEIDGAGWMLKFTIDESQPQVIVISLHPLERGPLQTNRGLVKP